jgi:glycosyltransferase involved in cell wall biosynthesis
MTSDPRISIILPVYNGENYIRAALESAQRQTFTDWEVCVVDDGSADGTPNILKEYASEPRITILRQDNHGLAASRNRGLTAARGDYVAFLDVDDEWQPTYLARMCAALDNAPLAVAAFAGWQYIDEAGRRLPQWVLLTGQDVARLDNDLSWRNAILPSALIARRTAVLQAGAFDEALNACEDWDLWIRLKALGPFIGVPQVLMLYRAHADSMTENVANMERERLKVNAKYLGSLDVPLPDWPPDRRQAVGFTYFNSALSYLRQNELARGREKIQQAVQYWPGLLAQDEFYYELGCAFQPRGLRGSAQGIDLVKSAGLIRDFLFVDLTKAGADESPEHWGQACLVLARLARNTGQRQAARGYALQVVRHGPAGPRLEALRLLVRSSLPEAWAHAAARLRSRAQASKPA